MKRIKIYSVLLLLLCSNLTYSQIGSKRMKKIYDDFMSRELLVVTEPTEKSMKKLKANPKLYEEFLKNKDNEHLWLKEAMDKYWTVNKPSYLSRDAAKKMMKDNSEKYALMQIQLITQQYTHNFTGFYDTYTYTSLTFDFPKVGTTRLFGYLPDGSYISKARYFAGIRFLNDQYSNKITLPTKEGKDAVKKGTLLLNKNFLSKKLTPELIKEYYPYNIKIVDQKEIDDAILNEEDVFYIFKNPVYGMKENFKAHMIINAKTGKMHGITSLQEGLEINKKVLKKYTEILE